MANEIKTPDEVVSPNVKQDEMTLLHNELNRDARRLNVKLGGAEWPHLLLYQEVRQAALNAHADLKAKCDAMERMLVDARRIQFDSGGTIARLLYGEDAFWWCATCSEEVDDSRVTYQERHDSCGNAVEIKYDGRRQ